MKSLIFIIVIALAVASPAYSCICAPPKPGEEVCGSDGTTFMSECVLTCTEFENVHFGRPKITKVKNGAC